MRLSRLSPNARFAIALGASIGVGNVLLQALTRNLGPFAGLLAGVAATALVALTIFAGLNWQLARAKPRNASS